jgi:hypothetical protein
MYGRSELGRTELANLRTRPAAKHVQWLVPYSAIGVPWLRMRVPSRRSSWSPARLQVTSEHANRCMSMCKGNVRYSAMTERRRSRRSTRSAPTGVVPSRFARHAERRLGARSPGTSRSLSAMWSAVARYPAGRERSQPALNGRAHALTACVPPFRVVRDASDQDHRSGWFRQRRALRPGK